MDDDTKKELDRSIKYGYLILTGIYILIILCAISIFPLIVKISVCIGLFINSIHVFLQHYQNIKNRKNNRWKVINGK